MTGKEYATCLVLFGLAGTVLLYAILRDALEALPRPATASSNTSA
jgi:hypothetical protein